MTRRPPPAQCPRQRPRRRNAVNTIVLFALRILTIVTLWAFIGFAIRYIVRERRLRPMSHPIPSVLIRLDAEGQPAQGIGTHYQLSSRTPVWIGRDPNCAVRVNNEFVSMRHARIIWQEDKQAWWIEDHNSHNGTRVNEARVMRSELNDADIIVIGGVGFRFVNEPPTP